MYQTNTNPSFHPEVLQSDSNIEYRWNAIPGDLDHHADDSTERVDIPADMA